MTKISMFRTSFVWVETVPGILAGTLGDAPFSFLGRQGDYSAAFDACKSGQPAAGALKLPWKEPRGNFFWRYYFEGKHAGDVTGAQAWKNLVPFRLELDSSLVSQNPEVKVAFEAFCAPQGVAVVARANYRGEAKVAQDVAKLAREIRYDYRFTIEGGGGPVAGVNLDQAAETAFAVARRRGFGQTDGYPGDNQPFSVTTFLAGEDVTPMAQGSDDHFLLETVTSWDRFPNPAALANLPLADAQLPIRGADAENMMYARKRGRAVWMPRVFAGSHTSLLSCYHNNLVLASLQALSLGEFVSWVAASHEDHASVALAVDSRAKRAASLLELFSAGKTATGKKVTYRSASVVEQIKAAEWGNAIAYVKALPS